MKGGVKNAGRQLGSDVTDRKETWDQQAVSRRKSWRTMKITYRFILLPILMILLIMLCSIGYIRGLVLPLSFQSWCILKTTSFLCFSYFTDYFINFLRNLSFLLFHHSILLSLFDFFIFSFLSGSLLTIPGLVLVYRHVSALGIFGVTALIHPIYGSGELPQVLWVIMILQQFDFMLTICL